MQFFLIHPLLFLHLIIIVFLLSHSQPILAQNPAACNSTCGSLTVKYPFGTGYGCGSPAFFPYVTCDQASDQLLLTTHTGSYPITSISYSTSTLTITPPSMSTCTSMKPSFSNLGLDWAGPFQLGPSIFLLLSCYPPTSSLTFKGSPVCDPSSSHLCASIYTCPSVVNLGLPLFPPANTCCVYAPANLNPKGELDLRALKCGAYVSVVAFGNYPTDPARWEYGVELKYDHGNMDIYDTATACDACERSEGVCGYTPPSNQFICVCKNGVNTSTDCRSYYFGSWSSASIITQSLGQFTVDYWPASASVLVSGKAQEELYNVGIKTKATIAVPWHL
ncbi:Wall-associated receptor kinase, galacturonan-binding domain [Dillenia turbinata]|uniref:non-specific serine/threonine protein kinase n=1 Tax=Dillenia turbinata TaxID=194707 RepID=A0AAN8Z7H9_9MAGN